MGEVGRVYEGKGGNPTKMAGRGENGRFSLGGNAAAGYLNTFDQLTVTGLKSSLVHADEMITHTSLNNGCLSLELSRKILDCVTTADGICLSDLDWLSHTLG